MGLDSFITEDSSSNKSGTGTGSSGGGKSQSVDHDDAHDAHKIIWNGDNSLPIEDNEVVIQTEEDWQEISSFIENNMGISIQEFEGKRRERKYEIAKKAKNAVKENERSVFGESQQCDVCGKEFVFPEDWNYKEIEGFYSCPDHHIDDFMQEFREYDNEV